MTMTIEQPMQSSMPLPLDGDKLQAFFHRIVGDMSGAMLSLMCSLGDRLNLFQVMAQQGPVTSEELAEKTGLAPRYLQEWLRALVCAGYLTYSDDTQRFTLPPEYALVLAHEGNPLFMGGAYQLLPALVESLDRVAQAFQEGRGIPQSCYSSDLWEGMERISASWFDHLLVQQWIPMLPELQAKLERGVLAADIGCGSGRALIRLAQSFPNLHAVGYDQFAPAVDRASDNAKTAGVQDRVRFEQRNIEEGIPDIYDLITTFNSLHDFANLNAGLQAIRNALAPEGTYLILEMNCAENWTDNAGPIGVTLYSTSVLYNLPVSLADDGQGLGTMGLPESRLRAFTQQAGFHDIRRLPIDNPYNALYALKG